MASGADSGVSVIIPWAGTCPHRTRARRWVEARYEAQHPDWEVVEGRGACPWVKAEAVADGLSRACGEILVVADADVWCDHTGDAVDAVRQGARWAQPHKLVHRLTWPATRRALGGEDLAGLVTREHLMEPAYPGKLGGGIVVIRRETWERAPMDRRFQGWGGEDEAWGHALSRIVGRPRWFGGRLFHLWHPPQERCETKGRRRGSEDTEDLVNRYRVACRNQAEMIELVEGGR